MCWERLVVLSVILWLSRKLLYGNESIVLSPDMAFFCTIYCRAFDFKMTAMKQILLVKKALPEMTFSIQQLLFYMFLLFYMYLMLEKS